MISSKNAARVAVQAQPCPETEKATPSPTLPTWPTWQQAMHVSLSMAESTLAALTQACHDKRGRNARQFEVECAVELALAHIRHMQADPPQDHALDAIEIEEAVLLGLRNRIAERTLWVFPDHADELA